MRVLLTTRGSSGHVGPLAPFGHACLRAAHEVVVAAQRQFEANVKRAGLPFSPVDDPPRDEWMPLMGQFSELDIETANGLMISEFFAGIDLRAELPGLRAIIERWPPDIIVRESWEFGSTLVAELEGIPIVRIGLGLAATEEQSIDLAAPAVNEARVQLGLPSDPTGQRLAASPYLTMMPEELEDPAAAVPERTHRFRFGVSESGPELPDWWSQSEDPLVYMTFGSVAAGEHLAYFPALYRSAIEALAPLPVRILVTIGDAARKIEELGEVPPNVHVETWVPHDDVARRAAVIVCHGGYGSTLGALAHGRPLVILPLFSTDQWANGDAVARANAGITIADDQGARNALALPGSEAVGNLAGAVQAVLDEGTYGREATRIADAMRALPPVDESAQALERIAAQVD